MGGVASPTARSYSIAPQDPRQSLTVVPLIQIRGTTVRLRAGSGAARRTLWCRVGAVGGQKARLFSAPSWVRMGRRDAGNGPTARAGAPSRARSLREKPSDHSRGKSDETISGCAEQECPLFGHIAGAGTAGGTGHLGESPGGAFSLCRTSQYEPGLRSAGGRQLSRVGASRMGISPSFA